ncbi:Kelch repeat-containing protein [Leptospira sp. GIMC2001]|uniref:Kelch repeat-containing protein n=1 Tax=Leptospira sp. GIMC2001 TaxID=1513297 RepID=UPI0023494E4E|nr:kelch repeat-containing protein [Leptospira sp. GIMC2001]WCL48110.1 galactose oxidase [Leptospira sp. GIMC2001]
MKPFHFSLSQNHISLVISAILIPIFFTLGLANCSNSFLDEAVASGNPTLEWVIVPQINETSAVVVWKCNAKVEGFIRYGSVNGNETWLSSFLPSDIHTLTIGNFASNELINYQVFCGLSENGIGPAFSFVSQPSNSDIIKRSIWIVGGTGSNKQPVSDIDFYDPIDNRWYNSVTQIPTPRINAQVLTHQNKIYIIGGIRVNGTTTTASNLTEVYDPFTNTWTTMSPLPTTLQGAVVGSVGESIYAIGGTTSTDMTTGTILDTVLRFQPTVGDSGQWSSYTSANSIFARVDMSGCEFNGSIYISGGRFYQNGTPQATSDSYVPSANSTTAKIEASNSLARHGSASACYRPRTGDTAPNDPSLFLIAGGSTSIDINQPVNAIVPSNRFEYSILGTQTNSFVIGSNLPTNLYYPAMEISYEQRKAYLFGGSQEINLPVDTVYSLELSSPSTSPWQDAGSVMPRPRFGHKAVILNR